MKIRPAHHNDLPQIISLCQDHALYERAQYDPKNKAELLTSMLFGKTASINCLVIQKEKSIVAYATFMKQYSTWDASAYIYLDCIFLKANIRGQGLGTKLMEKIKEYAIHQNCSSIQWQTPDFNLRAIEFYKKNGGQSKTKERFILQV